MIRETSTTWCRSCYPLLREIHIRFYPFFEGNVRPFFAYAEYKMFCTLMRLNGVVAYIRLNTGGCLPLSMSAIYQFHFYSWLLEQEAVRKPYERVLQLVNLAS